RPTRAAPRVATPTATAGRPSASCRRSPTCCRAGIRRTSSSARSCGMPSGGGWDSTDPRSEVLLASADPLGDAAEEVVYFLLHLYDGLPWWSVPIFLVALVFILCSFVSLTVLLSRASAQLRKVRRTPATREESGEDDFLWVFRVPALNEEVTIADAVGRLRETAGR